MRDVILIRPGWTDFDEQDRIQGSLELPLSARGQEQVELLVQQLRDARLDVVFSAPCEPARSTALAVCEACGATWKQVPDFRNLDHGLWQGLCVDDVRRKFPKVFKQWQESPETVCLPEGETLAQAVARLQRALKKCLKKKRAIGIVASEPLATLIGCLLRGCRRELPVSAAQECPERHIEFLKVAIEDWEKEQTVEPAPMARDNGGPKRGGNGHSPAAARGNGARGADGSEPTNGNRQGKGPGAGSRAGRKNGAGGGIASGTTERAAGPTGGNGSSGPSTPSTQEVVE
jgi:phosphoserine phosphatase